MRKSRVGRYEKVNDEMPVDYMGTAEVYVAEATTWAQQKALNMRKARKMRIKPKRFKHIKA